MFSGCDGWYIPSLDGERHEDGSISTGWVFPLGVDIPAHDCQVAPLAVTA